MICCAVLTGEARRAPDAPGRRPQADGGGHQAPRGHQRVHRRRPLDGEEPVPEVRARVSSPGHLHLREGEERSLFMCIAPSERS